jgi:hypothetical protein
MKIQVFAISLLFFCLPSLSQTPEKKYDPSIRIRVTDWRQVAFMLTPNYWNDMKANEIRSQIGNEEFEKMKVYSDYLNIPCQFLIYCERRDGSAKKEINVLGEKLSKLNAYRIAIFHHTNSKNKTFELAILRVPYSQNKDWDPEAKWDTVYFIIDNALVETTE